MFERKIKVETPTNWWYYKGTGPNEKMKIILKINQEMTMWQTFSDSIPFWKNVYSKRMSETEPVGWVNSFVLSLLLHSSQFNFLWSLSIPIQIEMKYFSGHYLTSSSWKWWKRKVGLVWSHQIDSFGFLQSDFHRFFLKLRPYPCETVNHFVPNDKYECGSRAYQHTNFYVRPVWHWDTFWSWALKVCDFMKEFA